MIKITNLQEFVDFSNVNQYITTLKLTYGSFVKSVFVLIGLISISTNNYLCREKKLE